MWGKFGRFGPRIYPAKKGRTIRRIKRLVRKEGRHPQPPVHPTPQLPFSREKGIMCGSWRVSLKVNEPCAIILSMLKTIIASNAVSFAISAVSPCPFLPVKLKLMQKTTTTIYLAPTDQRISSPTPVQSQSSPSPVLVLDTAVPNTLNSVGEKV